MLVAQPERPELHRSEQRWPDLISATVISSMSRVVQGNASVSSAFPRSHGSSFAACWMHLRRSAAGHYPRAGIMSAAGHLSSAFEPWTNNEECAQNHLESVLKTASDAVSLIDLQPSRTQNVDAQTLGQAGVLSYVALQVRPSPGYGCYDSRIIQKMSSSWSCAAFRP